MIDYICCELNQKGQAPLITDPPVPGQCSVSGHLQGLKQVSRTQYQQTTCSDNQDFQLYRLELQKILFVAVSHEYQLNYNIASSKLVFKIIGNQSFIRNLECTFGFRFTVFCLFVYFFDVVTSWCFVRIPGAPDTSSRFLMLPVAC